MMDGGMADVPPSQNGYGCGLFSGVMGSEGFPASGVVVIVVFRGDRGGADMSEERDWNGCWKGGCM